MKSVGTQTSVKNDALWAHHWHTVNPYLLNCMASSSHGAICLSVCPTVCQDVSSLAGFASLLPSVPVCMRELAVRQRSPSPAAQSASPSSSHKSWNNGMREHSLQTALPRVREKECVAAEEREGKERVKERENAFGFSDPISRLCVVASLSLLLLAILIGSRRDQSKSH